MRLVIPTASVQAMEDVMILRTDLDQFAQQLKAAEAKKLPASEEAETDPTEQCSAPPASVLNASAA